MVKQRILGQKGMNPMVVGQKQMQNTRIVGSKNMGGHFNNNRGGGGTALIPSMRHLDQVAASNGVSGKLGN